MKKQQLITVLFFLLFIQLTSSYYVSNNDYYQASIISPISYYMLITVIFANVVNKNSFNRNGIKYLIINLIIPLIIFDVLFQQTFLINLTGNLIISQGIVFFITYILIDYIDIFVKKQSS